MNAPQPPSTSSRQERGAAPLLLAGAVTLLIALPLRLAASEACKTLGEAVEEASSIVSCVTETLDNRTEFGTVVYRGNDGCYDHTDVIQGEEGSIDYDQGDFLLGQARRHGGQPAVLIHSHPYPSGTYEPDQAGLSGDPGDHNRTSGDTGFAESRNIPIVAIDTGDTPRDCVWGYDPRTNESDYRCE